MSILVVAALLAEPVTLALKPNLAQSYRFAVTKSVLDMKHGNYSLTSDFDLSFQDSTKDKYLATGKFSHVIVKGLPSELTGAVSKKQLSSGTAIRYDQLGPISLNLDTKTAQANGTWTSIGNHPVFYYFPNKPVQVGDTWQRTVNLDSTHSAEAATESYTTTSGTIVFNYRLAKLEGGAASVTFTVQGQMSLDSNIVISGRSPEQRPFSTRISQQRTIDGSGEYQIDVTTGLPVKGNISVKRNMDLKYPAVAEKQTVSFVRL